VRSVLLLFCMATPLHCPLCLIDPNHPAFISTFPHTIVILCENQGCPGWCTLVLRRHVEHLDELSLAEQAAVFGEIAAVARAIRRVFPNSGEHGGPVRINYECLGNVSAHVHWHLIPRHAGDRSPRATVWGWSAGELAGTMSEADRRALIEKLRAALPS